MQSIRNIFGRESIININKNHKTRVMFAYTLKKQGCLEGAFSLDHREVPSLLPHEILVKVKAVSLNPVDLKMRDGKIPIPANAILGYDLAGIVEGKGTNVEKFNLGDQVYSAGANPHDKGGSYAEYAVVHEDLAAHKPKNLSFEEAASFPLVGITAWEALFDKLHLKPGEDILIHAGAGGVGSVAIQLAKYLQAKPYTTISNREKEQIVHALGAEAINYREQSFVDYATRVGGFSKIFDTVGGSVLADSVRAVKPYGEIVTILNLFSDNFNLQEAMMKNITLHFVMMLLPLRKNMPERMKHQGEILSMLGKLIEEGHIQPRVVKVFSDFNEAYLYTNAGGLEGKVVVRL